MSQHLFAEVVGGDGSAFQLDDWSSGEVSLSLSCLFVNGGVRRTSRQSPGILLFPVLNLSIMTPLAIKSIWTSDGRSWKAC